MYTSESITQVISKELSKFANVDVPCPILSATFLIQAVVYLVTFSETKDHDIRILTHNNFGLIAILVGMICMFL